MRRSASRSGRGASTCFATPAKGRPCRTATDGLLDEGQACGATPTGDGVPPPGVEPGTARVRTVCSGQLSYGGIKRAGRVGDGGIGPPLLRRAPVLQTGRGTTRRSPKLEMGADGETRTPTYTGSRPAAFTAFATSALGARLRGPTNYSRKYSLRAAPSKAATAQAALLESGVPTRTGTDRCDPAFRSTPCCRARRAAALHARLRREAMFAACWSAQKDHSGFCEVRIARTLRCHE